MKFQAHVLFERVKAYAGFARGDFGGIIMGVGRGCAGSDKPLCTVRCILESKELAGCLPNIDCGRPEKAFPAGVAHAERAKPKRKKRRPLMANGV
jgi:hypothetical protein